MSVGRYIVFSDGACSGNPGPGAWACVVLDIQGAKISDLSGFQTQTTNNRMEMTAILQALEWIESRQAGARVWVFSDSSYSLQGIQSWRHAWKKQGWTRGEEPLANAELWQEIDAFLSKSSLNLHYQLVPGHRSLELNEYVDALAVQAVNQKCGIEKVLSANEHPLGPWVEKFAKSWDETLENLLKEIAEKSQQPKKGSASSGSKAKALYYLSFLEGVLERHDTWAACEARVKGKSGAKFQKVTYSGEELEIKKKWGLA